MCDNNDNNNYVYMTMVIKNSSNVENNKIIIKEYINSHEYVTIFL